MSKKNDKKKTTVLKRIAAKRQRTQKKRSRLMKEGLEAHLEKILGSLDKEEVQTLLLGSADLLSEPEIQWVQFAPAEAARVTKKFYESHKDQFEPNPEGKTAEEIEETQDAAFDALYADAIAQLSSKPMLFRLKSAMHALAKRAKESGKRELMLKAVCAEAMFRADIHVSVHPTLIVAYEKARNEGLGEELPHVRAYQMLEKRKETLAGGSDDDEADDEASPSETQVIEETLESMPNPTTGA